MKEINEEILSNETLSDAWLKELEAKMNADSSPAEQYQLSLLKDDDIYGDAVCIDKKTHGISNELFFPLEKFSNSDYRRLINLGEQLDGLIDESAFVKRGEKENPIGSFGEALDWLMAEAKRGQHIQRYKGLGEMNPEQLWETTMDPETRSLLQVNIEDVVGADEIFTTLMGDQVEPRRDFIETNALTVENLDI